MPHGHAAQLLICHEKLYRRVRDHRGALPNPTPWGFCHLAAVEWCEDCAYAVCDIHAAARHELHRRHPEP